MIRRIQTIAVLCALVPVCRAECLSDGPADDRFKEGVRLLEEEYRVGTPSTDDLTAEVKRNLAAKDALASAVAAKPDDAIVRAWYALSLLKTFDKDDALREADEAVRLGPKVALPHRMRGLIHAGRDEHEKALDDLNEAVKLGPQDAANFRARAQYFAERHLSAKAFADYASALKINQRDAKTYFLRAKLHMEAMNVDLMLEDLGSAIRIQPDEPSWRYVRGMTRMLKKDYPGAVEDLGAALKARPDRDMFAMRGFALTQLNRHEEAIRDFDEAMRFDADAKLFLLRGVSYQKLGRLERALQDFDEAVKTKPEAEEFGARGLLYEQMGRNEKAADDFSEAIRLSPNKSTFRIARADILLQLGRQDAALADYDEGVRLGPDKAESHWARGIGRLTAGHDGASEDFRTVLRLKGWRHAVSTDCILQAYAADLLANRPGDARSLLERALSECDPKTWPYPLLRCLHGDLKEADALAGAPEPTERSYAGVWLAIKKIRDGRRDEGLRDLRQLCDDGGLSGKTKEIARATLRRAEAEAPPATRQ